MTRNLLIISVTALLLQSCSDANKHPDASGTFESDEVVVSAQFNGQLLAFHVQEGDSLVKGQEVGQIDATDVALQKQQVEARIGILPEKTADVVPQVRLLEDQLQVQQSQLDNLLHEQRRTEKLVRADAATGKQLDDIRAQVDVVRKQMQATRQQIAVQRSATATQNRTVLSEGKPLARQAAQLEEQLSRSRIINPVTGTVLAKYAEAGEVTANGKALYRIADLSVLTLRAYVTGSQLAQLKLNQQVDVSADNGKTYKGTITWISGKAEFTPKTIQTKDERANLVYAIKVRVKNDGYLKIGMYGDVQLNGQ